MNYTEKYGEYLNFFDKYLKKTCAEMNYRPAVLTESMRYSLLSGGKRVRPVLFFATLELFGLDYRNEAPLALAIEFIHTYSLIHDDLPAMDNDDFRRGNPSNHKVFGEANAILAGDALLTEACRIALAESKDERHLRAGQFLLESAGAGGMIAGQSADLFYENREGGEEELAFIYEHKTGKLLTAPVEMAAILAGKHEEEALAFGKELGYLFQLTDDILDEEGESTKMGKTLGKDREEGKLTCLKVFGKKHSELRADRSAARCLKLLGALGGNDFLRETVALVRGRNN